MKILVIIFTISILSISIATGQKVESYTFSYNPEGQKLTTLIQQAEANFDVEFFYKTHWIDSIRVKKVQGNRLLELLQTSLSASGFSVSTKEDHFIFIYPDSESLPDLSANPNQLIATKVARIAIGEPGKMDKNQPAKITGYVSDATGEVIPGVSVSVNEGISGTITSPLGYYQISLLPGEYSIDFSYLGYEAEEKKVNVYSDGTLNINLFEKTAVLEEITVEEEGAQERLENTSLGKNDLSIYTINKMPAFLGESDVIKSITVLPGVSVTGESSSYISVRGGNYDQNLILMNNIPIYNPSHLLGFFSVFNGDMVSKVSLYKAGIPARYESRASSVLDVKLSPRAENPITAYGGIGILTSSLGVKGKIDRFGYSIGSRITYSDWILNLVPDQDAKSSAANFWDLNGVFDFQVNQNNTLEATFYRSADQFRFRSDTTYGYDQLGFSLSWNHLFPNQLLYNLIVSHSDYSYQTNSNASGSEFQLSNGIIQSGIQNNFAYSRGQHTLEAGLHFQRLNANAGSLTATERSSVVVPKTVSGENAFTYSVYAEDEIKLLESLRLKAGLRYNLYQLMGPYSSNTYLNDQPKNEFTVNGSKEYTDGEPAVTYSGLEPRIALSYTRAQLSIKLGYNRLYQFQHLISNAISITPLDQWKLSDPFIQPVISDQVSMGVFRNFKANTYETSIEGYVKRYQNLPEFKNGADILLNESLEQVVIGGDGRAWGIELMLAKRKGKTQGWASYAYARTFIRTDNPHSEERLNNGRWYPYYSDRPHNISITMDHKITNRWSMGVNFKFASGRPISVPQAKFEIDNVTVAYFDERNGARIPDYHRADLSFTHENKVKRNQQFRSKWVVSFYNLYARRNAYSVYFKDTAGSPAQPYQLTIAGSIIPSVTYKFEFN